MFNRKLLVAILAAGTLAGCENDSSRKQPATLPEAVNTAPSVVITSIDAVEPGAAVTVEAMATDAEGNISSYEWTQTAGSSVQLSGTDSDTLSFTAPAAETASKLTFTLTVTDEEGASDSAEVTVDVLANAAPVVSIESVDPVSTQATVILSATASDDYSEELTYTWEQVEAETGYEVAISEYDQDASFVTPATKFNKDLEFKVTATDEQKASGTAEVEVKVIGDIHAQIKALTDAIVLQDFETVHAEGFLVNNPTTSGIFKWKRTDTGEAANITAPIALFLNRAGYSEISEVAFENMYERTIADPSSNSNFNSADLGVFLYAYEATGDQKYLDVATQMWPAAQTKYGPNGLYPPRDQYPQYPNLWGYDSYNQLMGAYFAAKHELTGAQAYLEDFVTWYETELPSQLATNPSNAIYTNLVFQEFEIGIHDETYMLTTDAPEADMQTISFALMSNTIEKEAAVDYLMDALSTKSDDHYSEAVAEAIGALHIFSDE